jgi:DHA1 family bicyclomycin/chloramphenicol resistance-like MFS transporter
MSRPVGDSPRAPGTEGIVWSGHDAAGRVPLLPFLMGLSVLGPLATHLLVPSLPYLQRAFATDYATAQLLISLFMITFGGAQIFVGALADAYGRRPVLLVGLFVFALASGLCALAPSIETLIGLRVLQGATGCIGLVLARAIVRDISGDGGTAAALGYLAVGASMGSMVAPAIGGLLYDQFGWTGPFWFLGAFSALALIVAHRFLPETSRAVSGFALHRFASDFSVLLRHRSFLLHSGNVCLNTAAFYSFVVGAAFVADRHLGLTPTGYGFWFSIVAIGYAAGNLISGRVGNRCSPEWSILIGSTLAALSVLSMLAFLLAGLVSAPALFLPMAVATLASGFMMPHSLSGVLSADPSKAGSASGLIGFLQFAAAAVFSYITGLMIEGGPLPMIVVMLAVLTAGVGCAGLLFLVPGGKSRV